MFASRPSLFLSLKRLARDFLRHGVRDGLVLYLHLDLRAEFGWTSWKIGRRAW